MYREAHAEVHVDVRFTADKPRSLGVTAETSLFVRLPRAVRRAVARDFMRRGTKIG
jgi:hypothetical protein